MAAARENLAGSTIELVHPVYLDVPMLVSFVAAIEGGFAFESEETGKETTGNEKAREATARGRAGFPLLGALVGLDNVGALRAEGSRGGEQGDKGRAPAHRGLVVQSASPSAPRDRAD
ncbi:MAG: hypothetical protein WKF33_11405 [Thermoleophilaceae bacterium]